jgi:hypothetical protein
MRIHALLLAVASILPACRPAAAPPRAEPPRAVAPQPWGLKQCEAAPLDYPDPAPPLRPAPVSFTSLPLDPDFAPLGIPLVTFRSAELVFHVSPTLPQAVVDCTVAAADDAVAFVTRTLDLPRVFDGGPTRDVFLLSPDIALEALERLDPGYGFDREGSASEPTFGPAFVSHPRGRRNAYAIFQDRRLPLSYLEIGAAYAHEWEHMVQDHIRGPRPHEMDTVVEGEAALMGARFQDAVVPGASSMSWDRDASLLSRARAEHPEMSAYELLTQPAHRHHNELTLFAYLSRGVDPPTLAQVRLLGASARTTSRSSGAWWAAISSTRASPPWWRTRNSRPARRCARRLRCSPSSATRTGSGSSPPASPRESR